MLNAEEITNWKDGVETTDRGTWSQTQSGGRFYPMDPRPGDFTLDDICHHLSMVNRYSGATVYPYSVAQHSVLCRMLSAHLFPLDTLLRKWALVHDFPEYMLGDHIRPVKVNLQDFPRMEAMTMHAMCDWLDLEPLSHYQSDCLKQIDNMAGAIEKLHLCPNSEEWHGVPDPIAGFDHMVGEWSWMLAKFHLREATRLEFPGVE